MALIMIAGSVEAQNPLSPPENSLPKLPPKPPTTGTITVAPAAATPSLVTPALVTTVEQPPPGEWKVNSNTVTTAEKPVALPLPALTLTPTTNTLWQPTSKPPPPSPWDAKPGKDIWR